MMSKRQYVLAPALLALAIAGGWGSRFSSAPQPKPSASAPVAVAPAPVPAAPLFSSSSSEADEALQISMLLGGPLEPAALADSRRREAQERAERLGAQLRQHPAAWADVLDLLCILEPEDKAVALAGLLSDSVDGVLEPRLRSLLRSGARQGRCVALALLASRKNSDTLAALMAAIDDAEPRLRLDAMLALAQRRDESRDAVDAALARRARIDPDPILQDTARRLLGEQVPSRYPAPAARRSAFAGSSLASRRPPAAQ